MIQISMHKIARKVKISVDAMGGEKAPTSVIRAIKFHEHSNIHFLICGNKQLLLPLLEEYKVPETIYQMVDTSSVILDTDKPTEALKGKKDSSMRAAIDLVHSKESEACVSAGNTGTLMFTSRMVLGSVDKIRRPAIIGLFPGKKGKSVVLDLGANSGCDEIALSQFALMGLHFAQIVLKKDHPKVGLLNVGVESNKGRELEQKTYGLLTSIMPENFIGCVEANEIMDNRADVIVTDGFSGNILLKGAEGIAKTFIEQITSVLSKNILTKACGAIIKPYIKKQMEFLDPRRNNGAMFIGINGIVVKSHGNSDEIAFSSAIDVAASLARNDVNDRIIASISGVEQDKEVHKSEIINKIKETSAKIFGIKS